jgi:sulfur carrier protein
VTPFFIEKEAENTVIQVNGASVPLAEGMTVLVLLETQGFRPERVAVERNGEIVPRAAFPQTVLAPGDRLEIVQFVGGG